MPFLVDHLKTLLFALLTLAAMLIVANAPAPPEPAPPAVMDDPWQLPRLPVRDSKKAVATINAKNFWGATAEAGATAGKPQWRRAGIIRRGNERYLLINHDNKPVALLKEGDELPDGIKIIRIEDDRFHAIIDGQPRVFESYKQ